MSVNMRVLCSVHLFLFHNFTCGIEFSVVQLFLTWIYQKYLDHAENRVKVVSVDVGAKFRKHTPIKPLQPKKHRLLLRRKVNFTFLCHATFLATCQCQQPKYAFWQGMGAGCLIEKVQTVQLIELILPGINVIKAKTILCNA